MEHCEHNTEQLIKEKAKCLFFIKGQIQATSQEISDFAGVNRTLVNYYFRSRNNLFATVFNEVKGELTENIKRVFLTKDTFQNKIRLFIETFHTYISKYPYIEIIFMNDINKVGAPFAMPTFSPMVASEFTSFIQEIEVAMNEGIITKMCPINYMINMFSLVSYPIIMKPLFQTLLGVDDEKISQIMNDRREMIYDLLILKK